MNNMMATINKKLKSKKGFTLIEMIVVVAIIAILIALIVPNVMRFIRTANQTAANANAKTIFVAAQTYITYLYTNEPGHSLVTGTSTGNNAEIVKEYLAGNILGNGASGTFDVSKGAVTNATWTKGAGGVKGAYPVPVKETDTP